MCQTRRVLTACIGMFLLITLCLWMLPERGARVLAEETTETETAAPTEEALIPIYRLYYRPTHEHLFTRDANEVNVLTQQGAWVYEGISWMAPADGAPVYRLFNPYSKEHLYTADFNEYQTLPSQGWQQEDICWYSAGEDAIPVYRLFSPQLSIGSHHYTLDANERSVLLNTGLWRDENIAWYAAGGGQTAPAEAPTELSIVNLSYENGTFDVVLRSASAPGGVQRVLIIAGIDGNNASVGWYDASLQADGSWRVTATYENHQGIRGNYRVQAHVFGGDGVSEPVAETQVEDPFRDVIIDPMLRRAKAYIDSVTTPDMTREQKLAACFSSFRSAEEYNPWIPHYHGADWTVRYASYYFDNHAGNCYSYASAFAYMAKALGYENVCVCSGITHGWVEIDGLTYDPQLAKKFSDVSYYGMGPGVYGKENYYRQMNAGMPNNRIWL